jgi:hypothetical protein
MLEEAGLGRHDEAVVDEKTGGPGGEGFAKAHVSPNLEEPGRGGGRGSPQIGTTASRSDYRTPEKRADLESRGRGLLMTRQGGRRK